MTKMMRLVASALAFTLALAAIPVVAAAAETPAQPAIPVKSEVKPVTAAQTPTANRIVEVRTRITVRNVLPDAARNLAIVLPPTVSSKIGTQRVLRVSYSVQPTSTRETLGGTEATFKVAEVPGGATLIFEQIYTVELLNNAQPVIEENLDDRYLSAEAGVESDHPHIQAAALKLVEGVRGTEAKAERLIKFVVNRLEYDLNAKSRNKGGMAGFESRSGVCSEYASLFVAMARASGIPARLVYGWAKDTGLEGNLEETRHVWAEYYDQQKGWISVDPTFAEVQQNVLAFDAQNHLAQDLTNSTFSASFGGRGLLSITADQTLVQLSAAKR